MQFNEAQQEAVDFYQGPCLTLAGPVQAKRRNYPSNEKFNRKIWGVTIRDSGGDHLQKQPLWR